MIQLIVVRPIVSSIWTQPNLRPGDVAWVRDAAAARHLIENGFCQLPGEAAEKLEAPQRPKSVGGASRGRSIASPSSRVRGPRRPSRAWAAALVSSQRT